MLRGTLFWSVFEWWLITLHVLIMNPWFVFKVAFLWFSMVFAVSYIFFLVVHKSDTLLIRQELASALAWSCFLSVIASTILIGLYEFILENLIKSDLFKMHYSLLISSSLVGNDPESLYKRLCAVMILISGLLAVHYVGLMLERWYNYTVSERYGWLIMAVTLVCWGFLWCVGYIL